MKTREIPKAATERQIAAADPERSVFVSANAGSGKTHVLVQRVINLLLRGEDPAKILCITFTKAAAANMATRVFNTLAEWTALDDVALDEQIKQNTGKASDAIQRATARRLFATALETPGGLKVQTIHAFCTQLLHQFPFEADVAARFEVLDEATTAELLNRLTLEVILQGAQTPDSDLGRALATAITSAADLTFKEAINEAIRKRQLLTGWIKRAGGVGKAIAELTRALGLAVGDTVQAIENEYLSASLIPRTEWPALMEFLRTSDKKTDRELADAMTAAHGAQGRESVEHYLKLFCTAKREKRKTVLTANFAKANAAWNDKLLKEQDRVYALVAREHAARARDRSAALIVVAAAVIERYRAEKEKRGYLDYEDLIVRTLALFRATSAAWVLYKLDLGVNHILVDEAQDTSPEQWEIIGNIAAEFPPGGSRGNTRRTLFAVGDEKQSIFSFQGAAPRSFAQERDKFARLFTASGAEFGVEKLDWSFRSATGVLEAVDTVFKQPEAFAGLSADPVPTIHRALPDAVPGDVEIWDLIAPGEKDIKEGWDAPFDTTTETSPSIRLAAKIARTVKEWIAKGARPGEVMVLVRQRNALFEAVIRALKHENIDVAGADRLFLTEHIAIMDLLVLGDALLLPDDDLALATVLKSPLFGLNDEQIYTLAHGRGKKTLSAVLRAQSTSEPMFAAATRLLDELTVKARALTPFAFYAHVLGACGGRKYILARLGAEASDPLDEFLNLALEYERRETPSLQGFLNWLRAAQSEVKRDMEMGRDEVRVMTVHGAKGLEAKNVILCDVTTVRPEGAYPPRLLTTPIDGAPPGSEALIWAAAKDKDAGPMAGAREKILQENRDEYRRLLYVGLTRVAERLVVCGVKGTNKAPDGCWHALVVNALAPLSDEAEDAEGKVWRFRKGGVTASEERAATLPTELPGWAHLPAKSEAPSIRIDRPSDAADDDVHGGVGLGREKARERGTLMHRLLQSLPDIPADRRADAARRYLDRAAEGFAATERAEMQRSVLAVLADQRFGALFGPDSRAEVSISGRLMAKDGPRLIAGQIDRLFADQQQILIADYKTSGRTPANESDIAPMYVRQLALYRAVLAKLYPQHTIRCALLWTEVPELVEVSAAAMDAELARHLGVTAP